jgi:hypothetical protein
MPDQLMIYGAASSSACPECGRKLLPDAVSRPRSCRGRGEYALWQRRELTPEEIAEQNDFFRAWIEKVVILPARRSARPRKDTPSDVPDRVRIVWR